jgi:hypothetical protein
VWALSFLTVLAPSEGYDATRGRRHKALTDWGRQMFLQARRWLPTRALVGVAASGDATIALLARSAPSPAPERPPAREERPPTNPGGLPRGRGDRLDDQHRQPVRAGRAVELAAGTAVWYHRGLPPVPRRWVLIRAPQGPVATQAPRRTDLLVEPAQALAWFVRRWQREGTVAADRRHLGVEPQRQWSDRAIQRTTPARRGRFSCVTRYAPPRRGPPGDRGRQAAWEPTPRPPCAAALALVRRALWVRTALGLAPRAPEVVDGPRAFVARLTNALCYAA